VHVAEIDLRHASTRLSVPVRPDITYRQAQVLVRWGARTLGVVRAAINDGDVDMAAVRALGSGTDADHEIALPAMLPSVSVVVPTADRPDAVSRCVKSLLATNYPELDVLIVDNRPGSSNAGALRALAASDVRVRYVAEPRKGVSSARNTGAVAADGEFVAFVDDDIDVDQWWLHALVAEFTDPTLDAATSLVLPSRLDTPAQVVFDELRGFGQGTRRRRFGPEVAATDPLYPFAPGRFGPGGAALWRRSSFVRLGGFRGLLGPGTPARAGEDLEMFLRLARAGGRILYNPDAVAWHDHRADWPGLRDQLYGYGVGLTAMYTAYFARRPWELVALARRAPAVVAHARALRSPRPAASSPALAAPFLRLERRGLVAGPLAYLRSAVTAPRRATNASRSGR
jgi:GT2 family glycosyltransferase